MAVLGLGSIRSQMRAWYLAFPGTLRSVYEGSSRCCRLQIGPPLKAGVAVPHLRIALLVPAATLQIHISRAAFSVLHAPNIDLPTPVENQEVLQRPSLERMERSLLSVDCLGLISKHLSSFMLWSKALACSHFRARTLPSPATCPILLCCLRQTRSKSRTCLSNFRLSIPIVFCEVRTRER